MHSVNCLIMFLWNCRPLSFSPKKPKLTYTSDNMTIIITDLLTVHLYDKFSWYETCSSIIDSFLPTKATTLARDKLFLNPFRNQQTKRWTSKLGCLQTQKLLKIIMKPKSTSFEGSLFEWPLQKEEKKRKPQGKFMISCNHAIIFLTV